jgi:heme oxygenase
MTNSSVDIPLAKALPSGHVFLRRATSRLHQRRDQGSVLTVLTIPTGVTLDLYREAMLSLQRAYQEIDWLLVQACALCPAALPPYIPRVPSITRDLNALGVIPHDLRSASGHSRLARHHGLRAPDTEAAYPGVRYVVEGAQLGSLVIYGHLREAFGRRLSEFGTFWTPGSILPCSWPHLLKILARMESRESLAAAARAARITFRHMAANLAVLEMKSP